MMYADWLRAILCRIVDPNINRISIIVITNIIVIMS